MNICSISYTDDFLIMASFSKLLKKYTKDKCRVITFEPNEVPEYSDIVYKNVETIPDLIKNRVIENIGKLIKDSDLIIVSYGLLGNFYNEDYRKIDGEHMVFGNTKIWLLIQEKPVVGIIYPSNSLYKNLDWYRSVFKSHGNKFITFDLNIYNLFKDYIDVVWHFPPFDDNVLSIAEKTKDVVYSSISSRKDISKSSKILNIDRLSNLKYLECIKQKRKYKFSVHGDIFSPTFGYYEDLVLGITPLALDNEENRKIKESIDTPLVLFDEATFSGDENIEHEPGRFILKEFPEFTRFEKFYKRLM